MPTKLILFAACLSLAGCGYLGLNRDESGAGAGATAAEAASDPAFMRQIAQANMAEIATGKLAQEKAESPRVREYGRMMVEDHSALMTEGSQLAREKGIPVPSSPDAKHQAVIDRLEDLSGSRFDQAYLQQMVKDHEQALNLLQKVQSEADDPRLRQHAQKAIPQIRQHLDLAQRMTGEIIGRAQ